MLTERQVRLDAGNGRPPPLRGDGSGEHSRAGGPALEASGSNPWVGLPVLWRKNVLLQTLAPGLHHINAVGDANSGQHAVLEAVPLLGEGSSAEILEGAVDERELVAEVNVDDQHADNVEKEVFSDFMSIASTDEWAAMQENEVMEHDAAEVNAVDVSVEEHVAQDSQRSLPAGSLAGF
eukprot:6179989-Amphidinium_carterae.1